MYSPLPKITPIMQTQNKPVNLPILNEYRFFYY